MKTQLRDHPFKKVTETTETTAPTETAASTETTETPAATENTTKTASKLPEKLIGIKYVRLFEKQLHHSRDQDSQHGNRKLFMDDVFFVYLLTFFQPCIRSLRTLEDLSQTKEVQEHISIEKVCKSTLSDFNKWIDPERLQPTLAALREELGRKLAGKPKVALRAERFRRCRLRGRKTYLTLSTSPSIPAHQTLACDGLEGLHGAASSRYPGRYWAKPVAPALSRKIHVQLLSGLPAVSMQMDSAVRIQRHGRAA